MGSSKRENCIEKQLKRMFLIFTFVFHLNKGGNDQMKKSKGCSSITGPPSVKTGKNGSNFKIETPEGKKAVRCKVLVMGSNSRYNRQTLKSQWLKTRKF